MAATTIKKARPKFKLAQFRDLAIESKGMEAGVDLELDDGNTVHVPHPLMLSDERQDAFDRFQRREDLDQIEYTDTDTGEMRTRAKVPFTINGEPAPGDTYRMACSIIGEEQVKVLLAGGGHSNDVALAWEYLTRDSRLDSDPKAQPPRR